MTYNLITAYWYGCFATVEITRKLSIYMKDEKCLQLIQNDKLLSYEELLE